MQKRLSSMAIVGAFVGVFELAAVGAKAQSPPMTSESPSPCPTATAMASGGETPMGCPSPSAAPDTMSTMAPASGMSPQPAMTHVP